MLRPTKALRQRPNNAFASLYYVISPSSLLYVSLSKKRCLATSLKPYASAPPPLAYPLRAFLLPAVSSLGLVCTAKIYII